MKAIGVGTPHFYGGNWKATKTPAQTRAFFKTFATEIGGVRQQLQDSGATIMIAPPAACLTTARAAIEEHGLGDVVKLGVQNPWIAAGAYTGATTFEMAQDPEIGAEFAIIGHSENRQAWRMLTDGITRVTTEGGSSARSAGRHSAGLIEASISREIGLDTDKPQSFRLAIDPVVNAQVKRTLEVGMTPILCIGETLETREAGNTLDFVLSQLVAGLAGLTPEEITKVIIAYEPLWAIGTGETATPEQAQEVHAAIDAKLVEMTGKEDHGIQIIYGGSMKPGNVAGLVSQKNIDGGLIGGASEKPDVLKELATNGISAVV
jgi:triosephosphate isomerase